MSRKGAGVLLKGEFWGGLASMLVAVPSAMAYGVAVYSALGPGQAGAGAVAGILGAIALGLVVPLFRGAPRLISVPCAPAAAVMGALVVHQMASPRGLQSPVALTQLVALMTLVALLSGGSQIAFGLLRCGRVIKYIPYPVVAGYLSGVGVIIFLGQVPAFLGLAKGTTLGNGLIFPASWQWPSLAVGGVTVAGMVFGPRLTKAVPAAIVGLGGGLALYFALGLFRPDLLHLEQNRLVIGTIDATSSLAAGLADHWRALFQLRGVAWENVLVPALTLSVLLSIDTLKTCVVVDTLTQTRSNSDRVLLGQGAGNIVSALLGGMPGSGAMGPTMVNVNSGGQTWLAAVLEGTLALVAFVVCRRWLAWIPLAGLAGILMVVGLRMFDFGVFHLLRHRATVLDFAVIAAVIVIAVGYNLIAATGAGLVLAILLFLREQMRTSVIHRKVNGCQVSSKRYRLPAEQAVLLQQGRHTVICELQGNLFFGTTDRLFNELEPELETARFLILDMRRVQSMDFTAEHLLERLAARLKQRESELVFSHVPASLPTGQDLTRYFQQLGLVKANSNVRLFDSLDEALAWAEDQVLAQAHLLQAGLLPPLRLAEFDLVREFESDHTLAALASCANERTLRTGEILCRRGDPGDELYLVRRGQVRIRLPMEDGKHLTLAGVSRGNFFGEMAFLDPGVRSADVVAVEDTELYAISRRQFNQVVLAQPLLGIKVFARLARVLAERLRQADSEVRALHEA